MNSDAVVYQKKILTIPNLLSLFRICLIPVLVWLYCYEEAFLWATIILILSGVTDVVDGFIARKFSMVSDVGKVLDPVADKLTQVTMLGCLATRFRFMIVPIVLMVIKETFATVTGYLMVKKTKEVLGAEWHGKAATCWLYFSIFVHLVWIDIPDMASNIMIAVCTFLLLLSAILYGIRNIKVIVKN